MRRVICSVAFLVLALNYASAQNLHANQFHVDSKMLGDEDTQLGYFTHGSTSDGKRADFAFVCWTKRHDCLPLRVGAWYYGAVVPNNDSAAYPLGVKDEWRILGTFVLAESPQSSATFYALIIVR